MFKIEETKSTTLSKKIKIKKKICMFEPRGKCNPQ